jgi:hypothetical protein
MTGIDGRPQHSAPAVRSTFLAAAEGPALRSIVADRAIPRRAPVVAR